MEWRAHGRITNGWPPYTSAATASESSSSSSSCDIARLCRGRNKSSSGTIHHPRLLQAQLLGRKVGGLHASDGCSAHVCEQRVQDVIQVDDSRLLLVTALGLILIVSTVGPAGASGGAESLQKLMQPLITVQQRPYWGRLEATQCPYGPCNPSRSSACTDVSAQQVCYKSCTSGTVKFNEPAPCNLTASSTRKNGGVFAMHTTPADTVSTCVARVAEVTSSRDWDSMHWAPLLHSTGSRGWMELTGGSRGIGVTQVAAIAEWTHAQLASQRKS